MNEPQTIENETMVAAGYSASLQTSVSMNNAGAGGSSANEPPPGAAALNRRQSNKFGLLMN